MNLTQVKQKAKEVGVKPVGMKKGDLIKAIQAKEGSFPCYGTAEFSCDQLDCCFRDDCLPKGKRC